MKGTLGFIVFALAVLLLLFFLSSGNKAPFVPADDAHRRTMTNAACAECHAPGKQTPLKKGHPPKEECLLCHKPERGA